MSDNELKSKHGIKNNPKMYYRLNRYKKIKTHNNYGMSLIPVLGLIFTIIFFGIIAIAPYVYEPPVNKINNNEPDNPDNDDDQDIEDITYQSSITIKTIYDSSINLADHQGKVVIVFFFGVHCPGCPDQADILSAIDDIFTDNELLILSICLESASSTSDTQLINFIESRQSNWPVIRDTIQYTYASYFNIRYKPTVIILDKNGYVYTTMVGTTQGSYENIRQVVNSL